MKNIKEGHYVCIKGEYAGSYRYQYAIGQKGKVRTIANIFDVDFAIVELMKPMEGEPYILTIPLIDLDPLMIGLGDSNE